MLGKLRWHTEGDDIKLRPWWWLRVSEYLLVDLKKGSPPVEVQRQQRGDLNPMAHGRLRAN